MAINVTTHQPDGAAAGDAAHGYDAPDLRVFVIALFFIFGGITSLNDIIIPKLKELFTLDHATSMLVQSAFFLAYALFSLPAAAIVPRDPGRERAIPGCRIAPFGAAPAGGVSDAPLHSRDRSAEPFASA